MDSSIYRRFVLVQDLIVFGHCHAENNCSYVLEAMYPLLTLAPLATHVEQSRKKKRTEVRTIVSFSILIINFPRNVGTSLENNLD